MWKTKPPKEKSDSKGTFQKSLQDHVAMVAAPGGLEEADLLQQEPRCPALGRTSLAVLS